jgi:hypothetical protein
MHFALIVALIWQLWLRKNRANCNHISWSYIEQKLVEQNSFGQKTFSPKRPVNQRVRFFRLLGNLLRDDRWLSHDINYWRVQTFTAPIVYPQLEFVSGLPDGSFKTKYPSLGKFWRVFQRKMLVNFVAIWSILRPYIYVIYFVTILYFGWSFGIFFTFWYVVPRWIWQPWFRFMNYSLASRATWYQYRNPWISNLILN